MATRRCIWPLLGQSSGSRPFAAIAPVSWVPNPGLCGPALQRYGGRRCHPLPGALRRPIHGKMDSLGLRIRAALYESLIMGLTSLIVAVVAVVVAAASAFFAQRQVKAMKDQVREMQRQFDESGPRVELEDVSAKYRAENPEAGMPVLLTLTNRGRGTARVKRLRFSMYKGELLVTGTVFLDLPESMIKPEPPFDLLGLDKIEWGINWEWLCGQGRTHGFDRLRPEIELGDGTKVRCTPILMPPSE
jgi:hypothetical protein